jgi:hypothetical protein
MTEDTHQQEIIYVASPVSLYYKSLYGEYRQQLIELYPDATFIWTKGLYQDSQHWLNAWPLHCRRATMLIFLTDESWIGRGVYTEIEDMLKAEKPVFYFYESQLHAISSMQGTAQVRFSEVTESWRTYCRITMISSSTPAPMTRKQKTEQWQQEQWQRENAKLKAHGFHWKKLFEPERWQLYDNEGTGVTKEWALQYCEDIEDTQTEAALSRCPQLSWHGYYSEAVMEHPAIDSMHQEGDSYVIFSPETKVEAIPEKAGWKRYTLPDGAVFVFNGSLLETEQEIANYEQMVHKFSAQKESE